MLGKFNFEKTNNSEKQQKLQISIKEVDKITDKHGLEIDSGIKNTVAILRAMGFPTDSSCAGHTNEQPNEGWGLPYIRIYAPAPKGWVEDKKNIELRNIWKQENLKYKARLIPLLNEFNNIRSSESNDISLQIRDIGQFGGFDIESPIKNNSNKTKSEEETIRIIKMCQKEISLFTEFLKDKYLKE